MKKQGLSVLVLGVALTMGVACKANSLEVTGTPPPDRVGAATALPSRTPTPGQSPTATPAPPSTTTPNATAVSAPPVPIRWQTTGSPDLGFELAVPADWVPVDELLDAAGTDGVLLADSRATAVQLRQQNAIDDGALVLAFNVGPDLNITLDRGPIDALARLLIDPDLQRLDAVQSVEINGVTGAAATVNGDPTGLFGPAGARLQFWVLLLVEPRYQRPTLFLWGADADHAGAYRPLFQQMGDSVVLYERLPPEIAGDLGGGGLTSHTLQAGNDDTWLFNGQEGRYATIAVRTDEDIDLVLTLIAPSDVTVATADRSYSGDAEAIFDQLLPETGVYRVVVGDFFGGSGRYTISVVLSDEPQYGGGGQIQMGQAVNGSLTPGRDDNWTFQATAGDIISIVLTPSTAQLDIFFELRSPEGATLIALDESFSGDPEILSGFELPVTGTYRIVVNSFSHSGGEYTLALDEGGESASNFYDAGDLTYGDALTETLQADEVHTWFFDGWIGHEIELVVTPLDGGLDMDVWLLDPNLQRLAMKDQYLFGEAETITMTLPANGEYVVVVREYYGTGGSYEIRLDSANYARPAGTIRSGQTVNGELAAGHAASWGFSARAGRAVDIRLEPEGSANIAFWLIDPQGRKTVVVDAGRGGRAEQLLAFTPDQAGRWLIVVREVSEAGGRYRLTLTFP